ncbi:transmembrane protein 238-like [Pygocentrus nattereri]|uniref:transmembrane protein 238-like n=1 Tax=Pygocentrus nattereri TaxID=42514 RepID=UPI0018911286|nr:transmembrane protein 238-like [Pygocentrus nattereri]
MDLSFIGGCLPLFVLAIVFDLVGFIVLFVGIFANLQVDGRFYGDFLILTGALIVFCSLAWWLMWYVGNIKVAKEGARRGRASTAHSFKQLARKLTERISKSQRRDEEQSVMKTVGGGGGGEGDVGQKAASPHHPGSKVTWGKSTCYHNHGYEEDKDEKNSVEEKKSDLEAANVENLL